MKLSIVIPVYNVEQFLRQGLSSVVNQSYKNLDIICVNDGSSDNSLHIIEEYARADQRIKVCTQENSGTYIARQVGVAKATGDYILFFDPDDWLELNACEKIITFIEKTEADIVQYGITIDSTVEGSVTAEWLDKWLNSKIDILEGSDSLWQKCFVEQKIAWNLIGKAVRTSVAKQAFGAQGHYCFSTLTDYFAAYYVYAFAQTYRRLDQRLYHYRHGVGVSTKKEVTIADFQKSIRNFRGLDDLRNFVDSNAAFIGEKGCSIVKKEMADYTVNNALFFALNRLPHNVDPAEWFGLLSKETDAGSIIRGVVRDRNNYVNQSSIIAKKNNDIKELNKRIEKDIADIRFLQSEKDNLYNQLKTISKKNKKHLKQVQFLITFSVIAILFCILIHIL